MYVPTLLHSTTLDLPWPFQVFISLFFGTKEGEGGSFALYQGLYPGAEKDFDADRTLTGESHEHHRPLSEHSISFKDRIRFPLLIWVRQLPRFNQLVQY